MENSTTMEPFSMSDKVEQRRQDALATIEAERPRWAGRLPYSQQDLRDAQTSIKDRVKAYATGSCLDICHNVQTRLSRKLRDEVYSYLISGQILCLYQLRRVLDNKGFNHVLYDARQLEIRLVGADTGRELTEYMYRRLNFHFEDEYTWNAHFVSTVDQHGLKLLRPQEYSSHPWR